MLSSLAMADTDIPDFKTCAEGVPIPPVDPEELKRRWSIKPPWTFEALQAAWSHEADISAVSSRDGMIRMLTDYNRGQLLAPWHHGEELDEAVFRVAATFPLRELKHKNYMVPGDEHFGFDPNAFVQRLVEETGIPQVWEPVPTKVAEGGRGYTLVSANFEGQVPDPEREATYKTRELLWEIWCRFSGLEALVRADAQHHSRLATVLFADFLIANSDLVQQVVAAFRKHEGVGMELLIELEQRAQRIPGSGVIYPLP